MRFFDKNKYIFHSNVNVYVRTRTEDLVQLLSSAPVLWWENKREKKNDLPSDNSWLPNSAYNWGSFKTSHPKYLVQIWLLLIYSIFTNARLNLKMEYYYHSCARVAASLLTCLDRIENVYTASRLMNYFPPTNAFF